MPEHRVVPFLRRSRIGGDDWLDVGEVPLGEEAEIYECDIIDPLTLAVKRTIYSLEASANGSEIAIPVNRIPSLIYKAEDQIIDFPELSVGDFQLPIANPSFEDFYLGPQMYPSAVGWTATQNAILRPSMAVARIKDIYFENEDVTVTPTLGVRETTPNDGDNYLVGITTSAGVYQDLSLDTYLNYPALDASAGIDIEWSLYACSTWKTDQVRLSLVYFTRDKREIGRTTGNWTTMPEKVWTPISLAGTIPRQTRVVRLRADARIIDPDSIADIALDGPMTLTVDGVARGILADVYQIGTGGIRGVGARIYL